jgi:H+/Cl- antiporter ClcA
VPSQLPFFLFIGSVFGALAALSAYLISYHEYRQRMLRPDQNPKQMALSTGVVTLLFFVISSIVLAFALSPP